MFTKDLLSGYQIRIIGHHHQECVHCINQEYGSTYYIGIGQVENDLQ